MKMRNRSLILYLSLLLVITGCGVKKSLEDRPDISSYNATIPERIKYNDSMQPE